MMKLIVRASLIALLAFGGAPAIATCANPTNCSCTVSASGLVFGDYNPQGVGPTDSVGTISASCSSDDPGNSTFTVSLSPGNSANSGQRTMSNGSAQLLYNLYTNASRSTIWGDDSGAGVSMTAPFPPSDNTPSLLNIYGRIPSRQNITPGLYSDVIVVTLSF